jgi:hypothetical protein
MKTYTTKQLHEALLALLTKEAKGELLNATERAQISAMRADAAGRCDCAVDKPKAARHLPGCICRC